MRAAILLLCFTTVAWASQNIVNDFDPSKPEPLCLADGQYLLHGQNRCKFLRCTYGPKAWKDEDGNTRFYAIERSCPYGTAVSRTAYSDKHNSDLDERRLCAERVAPHHGGIRYYDPCSVEIPHYPAYNTYPSRYTTKHSKYSITESKTKPHTPSKSQYPAFNPYASHFPSFHYKVRKGDSKSFIERHPNQPTDNTFPSIYSHYGHPAAHYPSYPSAYNHHPYPAYLTYPAKAEEETQEVEEVLEADLPDQEEPESENQIDQAPVEEEKDGEVEEAIVQEAEEEAAPEEAAEADTAEAAADPLGDQEVMEEGDEDEEGGEEDSDTGYSE